MGLGLAVGLALCLTLVGSCNELVSTGPTNVTLPEANIVFTVVGTNVFFNGTTSTRRIGLAIISYVWNFGDGSPPVNNPTPSHDYGAGAPARKFNVTLTVTDSLELTNATTAEVTIP